MGAGLCVDSCASRRACRAQGLDAVLKEFHVTGLALELVKVVNHEAIHLLGLWLALVSGLGCGSG